MSKSSALVLFVKNARLGYVKTRLASFLGEEKALQIYLALCERIRNVCLQFPGDCYIYFSEFIPEGDDNWSTPFFKKRIQSSSTDLGERMKNAFYDLCPGYSKVILIGSDIPHLTTDILEEAIYKLNKTDVVFGPALDGGYYLIGMKYFLSVLFDNMTWSNDGVLVNSIERLEKKNISYQLLKSLPDIDTAEDWEKYGWF